MFKLLLIALGGAFGSVMRYLVAGAMQQWMAPRLFPVGTLTVNVVGCLCIGFLNTLFDATLVRPEYRVLLTVGVLGGFTTFSTFGWETLASVNEGDWTRALSNVALNNVIGLAAAWVGFRAAQLWCHA